MITVLELLTYLCDSVVLLNRCWRWRIGWRWLSHLSGCVSARRCSSWKRTSAIALKVLSTNLSSPQMHQFSSCVLQRWDHLSSSLLELWRRSVVSRPVLSRSCARNVLISSFLSQWHSNFSPLDIMLFSETKLENVIDISVSFQCRQSMKLPFYFCLYSVLLAVSGIRMRKNRGASTVPSGTELLTMEALDYFFFLW